MRNKQTSVYDNLKPIHKEIYDQLNFGEFSIVNAPPHVPFEEPSAYASRQFRGVLDKFDEKSVKSFAKVAVQRNLFEFSDEISKSKKLTDTSIVAHYRSELKRRFELLNKGYIPIFGGSENLNPVIHKAKVVMDEDVIKLTKRLLSDD